METSEFYDKFMTDLWQRDLRFVNYRVEAIKKLIKRFVSKNSSILEIGCGNGLVTKELTKYAKTVVATDISVAAIENNRNYVRSEKCFYFIGNIARTEYGSNFKDFDVIVLADVLEHIPKADCQELFNYIKLALKQNGKVILTWPNPQAQKESKQIIEETVEIEEVLALSGLKLYYFSYANVDGENQYVHCVLKKKVNYLLYGQRSSWQRIRNFFKKWLLRFQNRRLL